MDSELSRLGLYEERSIDKDFQRAVFQIAALQKPVDIKGVLSSYPVARFLLDHRPIFFAHEIRKTIGQNSTAIDHLDGVDLLIDLVETVINLDHRR